MGKEILRRFVVDEEKYEDYDGEKEEEAPDDDWDRFNESFNW